MHKPVKYIENGILTPIQVNTAVNNIRIENILHDDEGENISEKGKAYSELTAIYWAWKNCDADYIGFNHYRRYLNCSDIRYEESPWGNVEESTINSSIINKYGLDEQSIINCVKNYDIVAPEEIDIRALPSKKETIRQQYCGRQ